MPASPISSYVLKEVERLPKCEHCGGFSTWTSGLSDYEVTTTWGGEKTFSVFLHRQCVGDFIILRGVGTTVNLLKRNPNDERQLGLAPEERRHV